jgi:hypothetical protein
MKFDLSSLIITVIALSAFIIPVTFDQLNKRKTSKTLKKLMAYANQEHLNINKSNVFQHKYALGLDATAKKLVYLNLDGNHSTEKTLDITKISKCRLHHNDITEQDSDIRKIGFMKIQFNDSNSKSLDLELYKVKRNLSYNEEENNAKKLVRSVNALI